MLFSVIVPVFNGKMYLKKCIESILEQSCPDLELILIDDGSTDGSGELCDSYAVSDKRVTVIHQKNSGQTAARQAGISCACGDYAVCVDADDWIAPGFLEDARRELEKNKVDLISYGFVYVEREKKYEVQEPVPEGLYREKELKQTIYPRLLQGKNMDNMLFGICGKVIRRQLLLEKQMEIPKTLVLGEDAACMAGIYRGSSAVYIKKQIMYFYRIHETSSSHLFRIEQYQQLEETVHYFESLNVKEIPDFAQQIHRYVALCLFCLMLSAIESGAKDQLPSIKRMMGASAFRSHMKQARFGKISLKTRIVYALYKGRMEGMAWKFLVFCKRIKKG